MRTDEHNGVGATGGCLWLPMLLILVMAFASCQHTDPTPEPDGIDCECGEVADVQVIVNTSTGGKEYRHKLWNNCTGNVAYYTHWTVHDKGVQVCLGYKW